MNPEKIQRAVEKLDCILSSIRLQNSGADVHTIGNIRNTASLLKEQLLTDPYCMEEKLVNQIIKNTHEKVVEFYRKKYHKKDN